MLVYFQYFLVYKNVYCIFFITLIICILEKKKPKKLQNLFKIVEEKNLKKTIKVVTLYSMFVYSLHCRLRIKMYVNS